MIEKFSIVDTDIKDLKLITPFYANDERGYFLKGFEKNVFAEFGLENEIYEDFESYSVQNVIRGMHLQTHQPQAKLVRAMTGEIWDVAVDLRRDSSTFGKWKAFFLSAENHKSLWIPKGFAHGFKVLSESALVSYKCIGKYLKDYDTGIVWDDVDLNIDWKVEKPIISEKDRSLRTFKEYISNAK